MHRRTLIAGAGAAGLLPALAHAADTPEALGDLAMTYALPLLEMHAARSRIMGLGLPLNYVQRAPALADAHSRSVTTPNVDTLYATAWLDLSEPVAIDLPQTAGRYFSLALMDMYSNNFAVLGPAEREGGGRLWLAGPGWTGAAPEGRRLLRSPTPSVWMLGRIYVADEADLAAARAAQEGLKIRGARVKSARTGPAPTAATADDPAAFFAVVNRLLADEPPPARDVAVLKRIARVGVGPNLTWSGDAAAARGAKAAFVRAGRQNRTAVNGWFYPKADLGDFGTDYAFRAGVSLWGLAALPLREAIYLQAAGDGAGVYDGSRAWRLRFAPGGEPPRDAFWSLTLYERTPEGRQFFFDTPTKRYAIKSDAHDLVRGADGSMEIIVSPEAPAGSANWLPSPRGPCTLLLRVYKPRPALLNGRWRAPAITPA